MQDDRDLQRLFLGAGNEGVDPDELKRSIEKVVQIGIDFRSQST